MDKVGGRKFTHHKTEELETSPTEIKHLQSSYLPIVLVFQLHHFLVDALGQSTWSTSTFFSSGILCQLSTSHHQCASSIDFLLPTIIGCLRLIILLLFATNLRFLSSLPPDLFRFRRQPTTNLPTDHHVNHQYYDHLSGCSYLDNFRSSGWRSLR